MTQEIIKIYTALRAINTISNEHRFKIIELLLKHQDGLPSKEIGFALQCTTKIVSGHINYLMKEYMVIKKLGRMKNSLTISNIYVINPTRREYVKIVFEILKEKLAELEKIK